MDSGSDQELISKIFASNQVMHQNALNEFGSSHMLSWILSDFGEFDADLGRPEFDSDSNDGDLTIAESVSFMN